MYVENSYLSKQLCFLFYVSSKEIIKKYTNYLKEYDLTYTGYIVLMAIENDEKLNIKKLGERVFLDLCLFIIFIACINLDAQFFCPDSLSGTNLPIYYFFISPFTLTFLILLI